MNHHHHHLLGVHDYEALRTKADVRDLLGVAGYYRDFTP